MSIRLRLASAFTLGAAVLFSLGSWLFVTTLSSGLLRSIDTQLATALGLAGRYASLAPTTAEDSSVPVLAGAYQVQVVDAAGVVRRASDDTGRAPLLGAADRRLASRDRIFVSRSVDGVAMRLAAGPYSTSGSVAIAAVSLGSYDRTVRDLEVALVVGGVVVVVGAGIGSYLLARAALSPVERLRREVAALSDRDDEGTVPVPGTHDELAALASTMNELLTRLHAALARQRAFVADASHELRTPFAILRGELELAGRPGRTLPELAAAVSSAAEEAARLNRLTDDLLMLARSDSDRITVRREEVEIGAVLDKSVDAFRSRARAAAVEVRVESLRPLEWWADRDRLRQAVDNLLDNALRLAPRGTAVVVRAEVRGAALVVEVLDRGPGFPPEFLPRAFERFARPGPARGRDTGGAGLGLSIVQVIAAAHGGAATAGNRPGGGAWVRLELPARTPQGGGPVRLTAAGDGGV